MSDADYYERMIYQAIDTTAIYMAKMAPKIDERFGEDYATENPVLLAASIISCALDMHTAVKVKHASSIEDLLRRVVESINTLAESMDGIAGSVDGIAESIDTLAIRPDLKKQ